MALVNEYTFDTQTGTSLEDRIGSNNGTLGGATLPTWGKELELSKDRNKITVTGGHGNSYGNWSRIELPRSGFEYTATDSFSVCVLFKTSKTDVNGHTLFTLADATLAGQISFTVDAAHNLTGIVQSASSGFNYMAAGAVNDGNWHLAVMTYYGDGTSKIYLDGVDKVSDSDSFSGNLFAANSKAVLCAQYRSSSMNYRSDLTGDIAYFANYNHALSTDEIKRITEEQLLKVNRPLMNRLDKVIDVAPVAHYPLAGNSDDISGNGNDGTDSNMTYGSKWDDGLDVGEFDRTLPSQISIGDLGTIDDGSFFTWLKTPTLTTDGSRGIFSNDTWVSGKGWMQIQRWVAQGRTGNMGFAVYGNSPADVFCTEAVPFDEWCHVGWTWNSSTKDIKFYINGELINTVTLTTFVSPTFSGARLGDGILTTRSFTGNLRDSRLYNEVITAEQVQQLYSTYSPPKNNVREDLKLYMPLNGSSNDYSGNDITVTNTGVSFEPVAPDGVQVGNFNGSSNKIKLPTGFLGSNISEFSYGGWFKVDSVASDKQLFEIASVTSDVYLGARIESTTQAIDFACVQTPATTLTVSTSTTIETDKWYHIAVSAKQNDFIKIYLNGVLEDSTAITVFADIGGSYSEYIGVSRTGSTKYFDGNMRGHKFFTKVLTPTEIDKLYRDTYIS